MFPTQVAQKLFEWQQNESKNQRNQVGIIEIVFNQLKSKQKIVVANHKKTQSQLPGIVLTPFSQVQELILFSGKQSPQMSVNNLEQLRSSQFQDSMTLTNLINSNLLRSMKSINELQRIDDSRNRNFIKIDQIRVESQFSCVKKKILPDSPKKLSPQCSSTNIHKKQKGTIQKSEQIQQPKIPIQNNKSTIRLSSYDKFTNQELANEEKQTVVIPSKPKKINIEKSMLKLITARCFVIICGKTLQTLSSRRANKQREMASLTKIMTCYLACQLIEKFEIDYKSTIVKISKQASMQTGTTANLRPGDRLTLWDLLHGMMLPSGNDAAYSIAEFFGEIIQQHGHEHDRQTYLKIFLQKMNEKAKELHLDQTNFANPHGLANSSNISTAMNLGKLIYYAQQNQLFSQIVKQSTYRCRIENAYFKADTRDIIWDSTNKLVVTNDNKSIQLSRSDCLGIKTGFTPAAGPCYAANFQTSDSQKNLIIVLLKTKGLEERFTEAMHLYEYTKRKMP